MDEKFMFTYNLKRCESCNEISVAVTEWTQITHCMETCFMLPHELDKKQERRLWIKTWLGTEIKHVKFIETQETREKSVKSWV